MHKVNCILLVDDDDITNTLNTLLIKRLKVADHLLIARNGKVALEMIKERCERNMECPNLIFLDINMPVMNGFEFLKLYAKMDVQNKNSIIVMMLTTSVNSQDIENAQHPNINGFINKPLTEEKLNGILNEYFKLQGQHEGN